MPAGSVLDFDSKSFIDNLPVYLAGVGANEISLKLQKPLLTILWHVNVCGKQVMASYKEWAKLFKHLQESWKGERLRYIAQNGVSLGKNKKLKCNRRLFCTFSRAYCARHMKWIHSIKKVAKTSGHSYPLMLVRLMIMLDYLQEVKTMQSSNFGDYKEIREGLPADNHENGIYDEDTENNQAKDFF